jgi:hypothetical protein
VASAYHAWSGRSTKRAAILALALALTSGAHAQDEDLVEDVDRAVRRFERPVRAAQAPDFRASDLYGKEVSLGEYQGANIVLTFLSPKCVKEAVAWLKGVQTSFLGMRDVVFVNVLHPGPTPAFSSRSASLKKIREKIEGFYAEARERMPPEDQRRLESTEIRWIVDWRRDLHERYSVVPDRVSILLIDGQGRVRESIDHRTAATERRLVEVLENMRADRRE